MEWVVAPLAVVLAFWLPGVLVLRVGGVRLHAVDVAAVAPAITVGICGTTAEIARLLGLRWGAPVALGGTALAAVVALLVRVHATRTAPALPRLSWDRRPLLAAVAVAAGLQLVVVAHGMGDPRRLLVANDAGVHMTWLRGVLESGQASAFTLTGADQLDGVARSVYPSGWHAVAALAAPSGGVAATFTWAWLLPSIITWTCGVVALTRAAFPNRPAILPWAALVSGPGVALPLTLTLTPEGMVPNSVGTALVPGVLALLVARKSIQASASGRALPGLLALAGLTLVHPNAALALGLLAAGWWAPAAVRGVRSLWAARSRRRLVMAAAGVAIIAIGVGSTVLLRNPEVHGILTTHDEGALPVVSAVSGLVTLDPTLLTDGSGALVFILSVVGAAAVWRRRGRPMAIGALVMAGFFLAASSSLPLLSWLDAPWYDESRRYAPVIVAGALPLAVYGSHASFRLLAARSRPKVRWLMRVMAPVLVLLTVAIPGSLDLSRLVVKSYDGGLTGPPITNGPELALLARLPHELSGGAVLSGPFSGGSYLYALSGYPTVPRDWGTLPTPELRDAVTRLRGLGSDPQLCADLAALGIRYLYIDPSPWQPWKSLPLDAQLAKAPATGVRFVDRAGPVAVYEVTACG
ncbi:MAG: hypothetical protein BGO37_02645 [Cellulomonas sp. 73-92]|uniref:DUF6541 family protein n=1 Tax=Cellulomonas sp. 73-92 TaxID=1895740 RepID=UPI00092769D5|nr:MAG: hypothetical protein BGO37_02645 [Cellulomonas sp. 73-92]